MTWVVSFPTGWSFWEQWPSMPLGNNLWNHHSVYLSWYHGVLPQGFLASPASGVISEQGIMTSQWDSWSQSYAYPLFIPFGLVSQVILFTIIQLYILHLQFQHLQDGWPPIFVTTSWVMSSGPVRATLALWLFMATLRDNVVKCWCQASAFLNSTIPLDTREPRSTRALSSTFPPSFSHRLECSPL